MRYEEFKEWCNMRACDGCWDKMTAITCLSIIRNIDSFQFWKREREWRYIKDEVERNIVTVIDEKIKAVIENEMSCNN